jgi:hypothetical protein
MSNQKSDTRYVFLDEGGNFDFSLKGTKILMATAVVSTRPFAWDEPLLAVKYNLLESAASTEYFHATEDKQHVRNQVFDCLESSTSNFEIHSVLIEKRKTHPKLQELEALYPIMLGWLLTYIFNRLSKSGAKADSQVIVITDRIPHQKKRAAAEKAIKEHLSIILPKSLKYQLCHHDSKSCLGLQVADYCNWAIYRKWNDSDERSYSKIQKSVKSEFDVFSAGREYFY